MSECVPLPCDPLSSILDSMYSNSTHPTKLGLNQFRKMRGWRIFSNLSGPIGLPLVHGKTKT
jgi:hypothetical protein